VSGEKQTKTGKIIINHGPSARVQRKKKIIIIKIIIGFWKSVSLLSRGKWR
jgi:hypothetical protein